MRILILGATGTLGRALVLEALRRGHRPTAQTRKLATASFPPGADGVEIDPFDRVALTAALRGHDAAVYALGFRARGPVTFFSRSTAELLAAMDASGVRRLIAVTGVGAGETRGHGGWVYDRVIFPLFTRALYADKDRQESLIRASRTDWTIVRPAPFSARPGPEPWHALTDIASGTRLSRITPREVAGFVLDCLEGPRHVGEAVFIGHGRGR